jgi:hypothetical protein
VADVVTPTDSSPQPQPPNNPPAGIGALVAVLGFAVVFTIVIHWASLDRATVVAILAAIPGILVAAYGRRRV